MFNRPLEQPPQLKWKFAHEPELLGWTIRARNYNTFIANVVYILAGVLFLGASLLLYIAYEVWGQPWRTIGSLAFFIFIMSVFSGMTHQRMNFAYRFTQSGIEYCEWKDFPKWALPCLKWLAVITAVVFLFIATIDPAFLIGALLGPGGMGLMYLQMAHSKNYQELHSDYHHHEFMWAEFTQLAVATNREVVDLKFSVRVEGESSVSRGSLNIFCNKKQKENLAEQIFPYLTPGVPFIRAKVNVPMSTD